MGFLLQLKEFQLQKRLQTKEASNIPQNTDIVDKSTLQVIIYDNIGKNFTYITV